MAAPLELIAEAEQLAGFIPVTEQAERSIALSLVAIAKLLDQIESTLVVMSPG